MTDTETHANTVREVYDEVTPNAMLPFDKRVDARRRFSESLDWLVARITELEQQLADRPTLDEAMKNVNYWKDKAVAAEARVAELTKALDDAAKAA